MRRRFFLAILSILAISSCSLLLDKKADQCSSDGECSRFANARCDMGQHLCVVAELAAALDAGSEGAVVDARAPTGDEGDADPCVGVAGCYRCKPLNELQFQNGCTASQCRPFDNRARLKNLPADGGLTPLPN